MMEKISIMQGRLSPRPFPKLQAFPACSWQREFHHAKDLDFYSIEWIFEFDEFEANPIWTESGRKLINSMILETGVKVESLCAVYFLQRPFFRVEKQVTIDNINILKELVKKAAEIGVKSILMPVLETAEIRTLDERRILVDSIGQCLSELEKNDIRLGFETEIPAEEVVSLVKEFNSSYIGIYYDCGNCAAKGYDMKEDMDIIKEHLVNIHIKDRFLNGSSIYIGEGSANFEDGIPVLIKNNFKGLLVLEAYFENDFLCDAKRNKMYIENIIKRSAL